MRKRSEALTGSSATGTVVVDDVVVVAAVDAPDDSGGSGGGGTMFGELRSPNEAACTGTPSMLTATPKAKSPDPSSRSRR